MDISRRRRIKELFKKTIKTDMITLMSFLDAIKVDHEVINTKNPIGVAADNPDESVDLIALNNLYLVVLNDLEKEPSPVASKYLESDPSYKQLDDNSKKYLESQISEIESLEPSLIQKFIKNVSDKIGRFRDKRLTKALEKVINKNGITGSPADSFWIRQTLYHLPPASVLPELDETEGKKGRDFFEMKCAASSVQCPQLGPEHIGRPKIENKKTNYEYTYNTKKHKINTKKTSDVTISNLTKSELESAYNKYIGAERNIAGYTAYTSEKGIPGAAEKEVIEDMLDIGYRDENKHICYICGLPIYTPNIKSNSKMLETDLNCEHIIPCGPLSLLTGLNCDFWRNRIKNYIDSQQKYQEEIYKIVNKLNRNTDDFEISANKLIAHPYKNYSHNRYLCELYQNHKLSGKFSRELSFDQIYDNWKSIANDILLVSMESAHGICNGRKGNDPWPIIVENHGTLQHAWYEDDPGGEIMKVKTMNPETKIMSPDMDIFTASEGGYGMNIRYNKSGILKTLHKIMYDNIKDKHKPYLTLKSICARNNVELTGKDIEKVCYIHPTEDNQTITYLQLITHLKGLADGHVLKITDTSSKIELWKAFTGYIFERGFASHLTKVDDLVIPLPNRKKKKIKRELIDLSSLMFMNNDDATRRCLSADRSKIDPIDWIRERERVIYKHTQKIVRVLFKYKQVTLCQHSWLTRRAFCYSYKKKYKKLPSKYSPFNTRGNVPLIQRGLLNEDDDFIQKEVLIDMLKIKRKIAVPTITKEKLDEYQSELLKKKTHELRDDAIGDDVSELHKFNETVKKLNNEWWNTRRILPKKFIDNKPGSVIVGSPGGGGSRDESPDEESPDPISITYGENTVNIENFEDLVYKLICSFGDHNDLENNEILDLITSDNTIDSGREGGYHITYVDLDKTITSRKINKTRADALWTGSGGRQMFRFFDEKLLSDPIIEEWIKTESMESKIKNALMGNILMYPDDVKGKLDIMAEEDVDESIDRGLEDIFENENFANIEDYMHFFDGDEVMDHEMESEMDARERNTLKILTNIEKDLEINAKIDDATEPVSKITKTANASAINKLTKTFLPLHSLDDNEKLWNSLFSRARTIPESAPPRVLEKIKEEFERNLKKNTIEIMGDITYPANFDVSVAEINNYVPLITPSIIEGRPLSDEDASDDAQHMVLISKHYEPIVYHTWRWLQSLIKENFTTVKDDFDASRLAKLWGVDSPNIITLGWVYRSEYYSNTYLPDVESYLRAENNEDVRERVKQRLTYLFNMKISEEIKNKHDEYKLTTPEWIRIFDPYKKGWVKSRTRMRGVYRKKRTTRKSRKKKKSSGCPTRITRKSRRSRRSKKYKRSRRSKKYKRSRRSKKYKRSRISRISRRKYRKHKTLRKEHRKSKRRHIIKSLNKSIRRGINRNNDR